MSEDDLLTPWETHVEFMQQVFGRRDPECHWCHQRVWMSLQFFFGGGTWTTDQDLEGPTMNAQGPSTECPESPDGANDVLERDDELFELPSEPKEER